MAVNRNFHPADYIVFGISLSLSAVVGVLYAWRGRHHATTSSFLLGDRSMGVLPLTTSLIVSVISAVTLLGLPAEMYSYGSQYFFNFGSGLGIILTAVIFVPLLHPLQLTSMFEYLERRFDSKVTRLVGSVMEILALLLYGGTALFAPATALEGVTPFPVWGIVLALGALVTFYTSLGGLRGVVWSDVIQAFIMVTGILAVFIQGCISVGGISEVFRLNKEGDRLHFYNFDPNPTKRHTFWGLSVGFCFGGLAFYGASQFTFQRFNAVKTLKQARLTVLLNVPAFYVFHVLLCFTGLIIYAFYRARQCDPLVNKQISSYNQILPAFVLDTLGSVPGLSGLFLAALTSGALSTISSVMNSVSALIWDDLLKSKLTFMSDSGALMATKMTVIIAGAIIIGLTFLADSFGPHIFQVSFAFLGASGGPQLGMFLLGALVPSANKIGAISGCICGLAMTTWIIIGSIIHKIPPSFLPPAPSNSCLAPNNSAYNGVTVAYNASVRRISGMEVIGVTQLYERDLQVTTGGPVGSLNSDKNSEIFGLYRVSYTWYTAVGAGVCMIVGIIISQLTGGCQPDSSLVLPWWSKFKALCARMCGCCQTDDVPKNHMEMNSAEKIPVEAEQMLNGKDSTML